MILVGDLVQLPLVNDRLVYETREGHGMLLWKEFQIVATLNHIFREDGQRNEKQIFCVLLSNIRIQTPQ